ncbi:MAG TPA: hypothetical protein VGM08_04835 [Candidatus Saccharimonadales bacterium]|jgi:hypothetical protein
MVFQSAGAARSRYRSQRGRRRLLAVIGLVLVLAVLGIAMHLVMSSKAAGNLPAKASPSLSFPAKQAADVNLVAGAIGQYASANGALPTSLSAAPDGGLVLCGTVCDPSLYEVGGLSVYQAANIKLVSYGPGLEVPNQNTMYVVPGAKCASDGRAGDPNQTPRSAVILYGTQTSTSTTPGCVVL